MDMSDSHIYSGSFEYIILSPLIELDISKSILNERGDSSLEICVDVFCTELKIPFLFFGLPLVERKHICDCRLACHPIESSTCIDLVEPVVKVKKARAYCYWHLGRNPFCLLLRICQLRKPRYLRLIQRQTKRLV